MDCPKWFVPSEAYCPKWFAEAKRLPIFSAFPLKININKEVCGGVCRWIFVTLSQFTRILTFYNEKV